MDKRNCIFEKRCFDYFFNQLIYRYLGENTKVRKGEGVSSIYKLAASLGDITNIKLTSF